MGTQDLLLHSKEAFDWGARCDYQLMQNKATIKKMIEDRKKEDEKANAKSN